MLTSWLNLATQLPGAVLLPGIILLDLPNLQKDELLQAGHTNNIKHVRKVDICIGGKFVLQALNGTCPEFDGLRRVVYGTELTSVRVRNLQSLDVGNYARDLEVLVDVDQLLLQEGLVVTSVVWISVDHKGQILEEECKVGHGWHLQVIIEVRTEEIVQFCTVDVVVLVWVDDGGQVVKQVLVLGRETVPDGLDSGEKEALQGSHDGGKRVEISEVEARNGDLKPQFHGMHTHLYVNIGLENALDDVLAEQVGEKNGFLDVGRQAEVQLLGGEVLVEEFVDFYRAEHLALDQRELLGQLQPVEIKQDQALVHALP